VVGLHAPRLDLVASYCGLVEEFRQRGEKPVPFTLEYPSGDPVALIARFERDRRGIDLPADFVPHSTFWLVRDGAEVVGVSNLRHRLTPFLLREGGNVGYGIRPSSRRNGSGREILRLTLPKARELGLSRVLVTCGESNLGSARIILTNGGILESEEFSAERDEVVQRYWIDLRS
jgi:predicted acetyltransferase